VSQPVCIGRFAPSPTGPLHEGSLVAALASYLHARTRLGRWLVRIEDIDTPRCVPGADRIILQQLASCGLHSDGAVLWQSQRSMHYQEALERLIQQSRAYPCACSRKDIEYALLERGLSHERHPGIGYPGSCRPENGGLSGRPARAWRFHVGSGDRAHVGWHDEGLGTQQQQVDAEVGDFVVRRADGLWAYQLAVVVDDAAQGITHVVRGQDLMDNTARQILLQQALGLPRPVYRHTPLVMGIHGEKLSKQNGAQPIDTGDPLAALNRAAGHLGLPPQATGTSPEKALETWAALGRL